MNALNLFQMTEEQLRLNALLEENGGELTPEIEEALAINENNFITKSENYAKAINHYKAMVDAVDAETKRLAGIKKTCNNIVERMKDRLADAMQAFDKEKVDVGTFKLSLRSSESVVIDDELAIPDNCKVIEVKVSKTAIKEQIKQGIEVPGAHIETNKSLQIR